MTGRQPNRQPRGPRATLPKPPPLPPCGPNEYPESSSDPWFGHNSHLCACWHQYDECPCNLVAHQSAHPTADCHCTLEDA
jgi:hypothetical protein